MFLFGREVFFTLISVFLTVDVVVLLEAVPDVVLVTVVLRLAVNLLALSFFSFSTSALFVTVLVKGTRGLGAALVIVLGLGAVGVDLVANIVRVVVVVVV